MSRVVHLVGSVPLADCEAVLRMTAQVLRESIKRMPDGETGPRTNWVQWLAHLLRDHPQIELPEGKADPSVTVGRSYYRVKQGIDPASVAFGELGYARHAREAYAVFARLKAAGVIHSGARLLVTMPTPLAFLQVLIAAEQRAALEAAYWRQALAEVTAIAAVAPHNELAIQWDTVFELLVLEGARQSGIDDSRAGQLERLRQLGAAVPADIELGYHFCYGDLNHRHAVQPKDAGLMVGVANDLSRELSRPIDFIHMPVPRNRDDHSYFAPLSSLALPPKTELYLGLVHYTDGIEGTLRRLAAAKQVRNEFGIATECGFGRRSPETVRHLLEMHAEVARH